jgi:hypothetical protein
VVPTWVVKWKCEREGDEKREGCARLCTVVHGCERDVCID